MVPSLILLFFLFISNSGNNNFVSATKHTFATKNDRRTFIGPLGLPFGFLDGGEYSLRVYHFKLHLTSRIEMAAKGKTNNNISLEEEREQLNGLHPGFLLKRFETEAEFERFQDTILDNPTICGFEPFLTGEFAINGDKLYIGNDDSLFKEHDSAVAVGPGVIDGGSEGIFLSMKNDELMWAPNTPSLNHTFVVDEVGYYFLFYQICLPVDQVDMTKFLFKEIRSTFLLDFHYKNYDLLGKASYLTAGEMPLPHMFLYFSVSYSALLALWVIHLNNGIAGQKTQREPKPKIYAIHHLMSSVLFLKVLTVFFESVRYHFIRVNGHAELWSVVYYMLSFFKGVFLFTVILLIGSGWSFFKPYLTHKERRVILFVIVLQIIDNIAVVVLTHETVSERLYNDWSTVLHLVDILSCCAVLVPIVWQVNSLEESAEVGSVSTQIGIGEDGDDGNKESTSTLMQDATEDNDKVESSRIQAKLELFRSFYLIVVAYIYFTRIVIYLFASSLKYNQTWLRYLVSELGTLVFYFAVGMKFKPVVEVSYSQLSNQVDDYDDNDALEYGKEGNIELGGLKGKIGKD